jgi:DNA-directed RNA polymerase subunit beta'
MGAECIMDLLKNWSWWVILSLRHNANTETSKQRKTEALKDYKLLNLPWV